MKLLGCVKIKIEEDDKPIISLNYNNKVLNKSKSLFADAIISGKLPFIEKMLFGDEGWDHEKNEKKEVDENRTSLFGITRASKKVIGQKDSEVSNQAIFTATLEKEDAVGISLSEMALQLSNGELYSMLTHPEFNKTDKMKLTFSWEIYYI